MSRHRFIRNKKYSTSNLSDEDLSYEEEEDFTDSEEETTHGKLPSVAVQAKVNPPSSLAKNLNTKEATSNQPKILPDQKLPSLGSLGKASGVANDIEPFDFASPSPDDIVLQKQGQAFKKKKDEPVNTTPTKGQGKPGLVDSAQKGKQQQAQQTPPPKFQGKSRLVEQQKRLGGNQPNLGGKDEAIGKETATPLNTSSGSIKNPLAGSNGAIGSLNGPKNNTNSPNVKLTSSGRPTSAKSDVKQNTEPKRKAVLEKLQAEMKDEGSKANLSVVVIGHVDSGKSTLMGHLLHLSGLVSDKTIHRYTVDSADIGKQSFAFAWVMDEFGEERERGVTIDVGVRSFQTSTKNVTILDAPGHKEYIPNMITGAAVADVAILVINALEGEFEKGFRDDSQTKEHVILAKSLGVTSLIVAVNKLDMCQWSEARFVDIKTQLHPFLTKSGFKKDNIVYIPCSGLYGINLITGLKTKNNDNTQESIEKLKKWYTGPTVIDAIDAIPPPDRTLEGPLVLPINDVYKDTQSGMGICVAGRVERGYVARTDSVLVLPINEVAQVKLIKYQGLPVEQVMAGQNVDVALINVQLSSLYTGCVLCDPEAPVVVAQSFVGQILTFAEMPILRGQHVTFHLQAVNESAVVSKLVNIINPKTNEVEKVNPKCLTKQTMATVVVRVDKPICLALFSQCRALGRFTLRDKGKTLAAGIITSFDTTK